MEKFYYIKLRSVFDCHIATVTIPCILYYKEHLYRKKNIENCSITEIPTITYRCTVYVSQGKWKQKYTRSKQHSRASI